MWPHDRGQELFLSVGKKVKKIAKKYRDLFTETTQKHVTFIIERVFNDEMRGRRA
jgi:hypothetical protein